MLIGLVKWFDKVRALGVVETFDNEKYKIPIYSFKTKPLDLVKGTPIAFIPRIDIEKYRNYAKSSRLVGNIEDWYVILSYLGKPDTITIEDKIKVYGNRGRPYFLTEKKSFSIIELSLKYIFKDKSEDEISNLIINYFDNNLDKKQFISYCELIEYNIPKNFSIENSTKILNTVFSHFGKNLNDEILFSVWKLKKFKFISNNEIDDIEIPEKVLRANLLEIGRTELIRISKFSFGSEFISFYVNNKFSNIKNHTSEEIHELYQFVEFEDLTKQETRRLQLDTLYTQRIEFELTEKANPLDIIRNSYDYDSYNCLFQLIPNQFNEIEKNNITKSIHKIIDQKCSDEFKPELWIKGIIEEPDLKFISKYFLNKDTQTDKRISILVKVQTNKQIELLKKYAKEYSYKKGFDLIAELLKNENSINNPVLIEVLFNSEFWKNKKGKELIESFTDYVNEQSNDEQKYDLFLNGYLKDFPINYVRQNSPKIRIADFKKIFNRISDNIPFIKDILSERVTLDNRNSLSYIYDLAIEFLDHENFNIFDNKVFNTFEQSEYFKLWEIGKAKIFPQHFIEELLQDNFKDYTQIDNWINNKTTTIEKISGLLLSFLNKQDQVSDKKIFYKQLNHIKYLLQINGLYLDHIKKINNDFYNLILWILDREEVLNFELLKKKFIYLEPTEQIRIVRKLFYIKAIGQFDLTIEKLNELTRFDIDLYKTTIELNPDIQIDISTDVVIKALLSFQQKNRFFIESELFTIVLNNLYFDKTRRLKFADYFEDCKGRQIAKYFWSTNGEIKKVKYGNKFYYAIIIPYPIFESLKEAVKKISEVKWNPNEKHWGVKSKYEAEVFKFAKEHRFFLNFEGSKFLNNTHLVNFEREFIPDGISFCEGRLSNIKHEKYNVEFWWCAGKPCFSKCETIHRTDEWKKYTLLDFCEILDFNTDETNKMGDSIPKGKFYQFVALINRFNLLLDKLYCLDCGHILFPSDFGTGHFTANNIVRFQCRNDKCDNNEEIYLNHCLNGKCNNIIDSRISKKCENGLFICNKCGSCCSHSMLERRLSNLKLNGGFIPSNLVQCVSNKLGHLERGEYFCFKCSSKMIEVRNDVFKCINCEVEYDCTIFNFKRPHRNLEKTGAKSNNSGKYFEEFFDDFDIYF